MTRKRTPVPEVRCDFPAAILKGLIEQQDPTAYFASLGGYLGYLKEALERGLLEVSPERGTFNQTIYLPTETGKQHYETSGLKDLPSDEYGRAYMWDWSQYKAP